ncbi:MAG: DNA mismatch endonuclease Vsr [Burkholderiales bacterium]|nr:MAG: DNA mismatch endonuclease Vsr [Burkholderiales bacterium]
MDILDPQRRSAHMRGVRRQHTKPELVVRRIAHSLGYRFRLHRKDLPGSPDIVFPRYRKIIFVHGCFWHGHQGCRYGSVPKTRTEWWLSKLAKNKERDAAAVDQLEALGWTATIVWECETRKPSGLEERINAFLKSPLDASDQVGEDSPGGS